MLGSKVRLPPADSQWARAFIDRGRGPRAETARSALTVVLKLVMRWSDQHHLDCFNLHFQDQFVPISLRPVLRIVAAYAMATVWSPSS